MPTSTLKITPRQLQVIAWIATVSVIAISIFVWGDLYNWNVLPFDRYLYFPLFGLLAFGLMWTHYVIASLRLASGVDKSVIARYYSVTSYIVLASLLLHPALLNSRLYDDGFGLPPGSYSAYVAQGMTWIVTLGLISLIIFLLFELHRFFADRSWWKYVSWASDLAMIAILYHGFQLGGHLQTGWFKGVWYFYGVTLVVSIIYLKIIYPQQANDTKK